MFIPLNSATIYYRDDWYRINCRCDAGLQFGIVFVPPTEQSNRADLYFEGSISLSFFFFADWSTPGWNMSQLPSCCIPSNFSVGLVMDIIMNIEILLNVSSWNIN